jgi:(2R)-sulfolactate sulfo-lyase subunit beta
MTARAPANGTVGGWYRENGRLGVRNHVVVLSLDDCLDATGSAIAREAKCALALAADYARPQTPGDASLGDRTMIGTATNPNVAGVVILASESGRAKAIVDAIARSGKPVAGFAIASERDDTEIGKARRTTVDYCAWAHGLRRSEAPISDLWISAKCEESDTTCGLASCPTVGNAYDKLIPIGIHAMFGETPELTGVADAVAARAANPAAARKWRDAARACRAGTTVHRQPTAGNIMGGITTLEEKGYDSLEKIGRSGRFIDVLRRSEIPAQGAGLYYMDTSSELEAVVEMVAGGSVIHLLPAGKACTVENPIVPVIQISANPATLRKYPDRIDLDVTGLLFGTLSLDDAGEALIAMIRDVTRGRLTAAETLIEIRRQSCGKA